MTAGRLGRPRQCPDDVLQTVVTMRRAGARLIDIADALNATGTPTPAGRPTWLKIHVSNLLRTQGGRDLLRAEEEPCQ